MPLSRREVLKWIAVTTAGGSMMKAMEGLASALSDKKNPPVI